MRIVSSIILTFLLQFSVTSQIIQISQVGDDIDGEAPGDESGYSISFNGDGNIIAIGAPFNQGNGFKSGHVRVFQNVEGVWTQVGGDIDGSSTNDTLGYAVSLSDDGRVVAIGAPFNQDNGVQSGHVRVFQNDGTNWTQIGNAIQGEAAGDLSGYSLSLSANGNRVAIGAYENQGNGVKSGHVRIFENQAGNWAQVGADIDSEAPGDEFGWTVSLNSDGTIVAAGARSNDGNGSDSGHVRVFQDIGGSWVQLGQDIDGETAGDLSGWSLSLNNNGDVVAIGTPFNQDNGTFSGHVRVFQLTGGSWTQVGNDIDGGAPGDGSGYSVSLDADGDSVAIGARSSDGNGIDSGQVRVFRNTGGAWIQAGEDINGEAPNDFSGWSVTLNDDGNLVGAGANANDGNGLQSGHVRVFELTEVLGSQTGLESIFSVHPSPTAGVIHIKSISRISRIELFDLQGRHIQTVSGGNSIDLSTRPSGAYFIRITDQNGFTATHKVVKQ